MFKEVPFSLNQQKYALKEFVNWTNAMQPKAEKQMWIKAKQLCRELLYVHHIDLQTQNPLNAHACECVNTN